MRDLRQALALVASLVGVACGSSRDHGPASPAPSATASDAIASLAPSASSSSDVACDARKSADVAWRDAACTAADAPSCRELAMMYGYGRGVRAKAARAKEYAEKGCGRGDGRSCYLRAVFDGPPSAASAPWLELGCRAGDGPSCFAIATLRDPGKRQDTLEDGCHAEPASPAACAIAASAALQRGDADSVRDALFMLEKADEDTAQLGVCSTHYQLTKRPTVRMSGCDFAVVSCGLGCDAQCDSELVDRKTWLVTPLEAGCSAGDLAYCDGLGRLLAEGAWRSRLGTIVEADPARAVIVLAKNCAAGFAPSCEAEAQLHEGAASSATDPATQKSERELASALREKACDARQPTACYAIAANAKPDRALVYYRKACELGMKPVCMDLAQMYATGKGAPKDQAIALELALRAK